MGRGKTDDKLEKVQKQVEETFEAAKDALGKVIERGEKIEILVNKTDDLVRNTKDFSFAAKRRRQNEQSCWGKIKEGLLDRANFSAKRKDEVAAGIAAAVGLVVGAGVALTLQEAAKNVLNTTTNSLVTAGAATLTTATTCVTMAGVSLPNLASTAVGVGVSTVLNVAETAIDLYVTPILPTAPLAKNVAIAAVAASAFALGFLGGKKTRDACCRPSDEEKSLLGFQRRYTIN